MAKCPSRTPEAQAVYWQQWYAKAKADPAWQARRQAQKKADYERHKAKRIATAKAWADAHPEIRNQAVLAFHQRNPEYYVARDARRRQEDPEGFAVMRRAAQRKYERANPFKNAEKANRRRARKLETSIGDVDYALVVRKAGGVCGICRHPVGDGPVHIDHIIPLARGGTHTQDNLQLAHARCNIAKGARVPKVG